MNNLIEKRVFLVGCPRSGTTLLQSLLICHSRIHSFPETHFFRKGFKGLAGEIKRGYLLAEIINQWKKGLINNYSLPETKVSWFRKKMVEQFVEILDVITQKEQKTIWIEKTPMHVSNIKQINSYIEDAKFIHIIRDGRAVVASLYEVTRRYPEVWGGARSLQQCVQQWNNCIKRSYEYINNENHIFTNYSSVSTATEKELKRVCEFLGVCYEKIMLDEHIKSAQSVIAKGEDWKSGNLEKLYDRGLTKYYEIFNVQQQKVIEESLDIFHFNKIVESIR